MISEYEKTAVLGEIMMLVSRATSDSNSRIEILCDALEIAVQTRLKN